MCRTARWARPRTLTAVRPGPTGRRCPVWGGSPAVAGADGLVPTGSPAALCDVRGPLGHFGLSAVPSGPLATEGTCTVTALVTGTGGNLVDGTVAPCARPTGLTTPVGAAQGRCAAGGTTGAGAGAVQVTSVLSGACAVTATADTRHLVVTRCGAEPADPVGPWSGSVPLGADGPEVATTQAPPAGRSSMSSGTEAVLVDPLVPGAPVITGPVAGEVANDDPVGVTGTGEPGGAMIVTDDSRDPTYAVAGQPAGANCPRQAGARR